MNVGDREIIEAIQRVVARTIATYPAGRNLILIGGFRYRFLDESVRASDDIDYHWADDLVAKQNELLALFGRVLLPEIRRRFGYEGTAAARTGPEADSPAASIIDLAFWKNDVPHSRIEIPVELTRIQCADPVIVRAAGGTLYATASEADMIESKVLAVFNRQTLQHRDLVDLFLFQDRLSPGSAKRLKAKLKAMKMPQADIGKRLTDLRTFGDYHAKAIQAVVDSQFDQESAERLSAAGGGKMILAGVLGILEKTMAVRSKS